MGGYVGCWLICYNVYLLVVFSRIWLFGGLVNLILNGIENGLVF